MSDNVPAFTTPSDLKAKSESYIALMLDSGEMAAAAVRSGGVARWLQPFPIEYPRCSAYRAERESIVIRCTALTQE